MSLKNKKLYRVDINLSYLYLFDDPTGTHEYGSKSDVERWVKEDFHSGELDESSDKNGPCFSVKEVKSVEDTEGFDSSYSIYGETDESEEYYILQELIDGLGLDAKIMIDKLKKLGYTVTKKK